ncbi:hypothetical protein MNBD_GAMMA12-3263 [hydrothermal vent metagenome]|uniref:DUF4129 domain-containing protein n=1 Tax=hydrothermal vent metagenome TaxID=652676 RepID=A0A3B0YX71_9ZZZZ
MKFEDLNAVIRPRASWEATDLGVAMVRRQSALIYISMLMFIIPIGVLAYHLFQANLLYAALLVWWLKPIYDRTTLYIISQSLFGSPPTLRQTLIHSVLAIFKKFPELLTRLFIINRSFRMPVTDLEGLKGRARSTRLNVLTEGARGKGFGITLILPLLEVMITISLMLLLIFLHPELELFNENESAASTFTIFYYEHYWLFVVFYALYILSIIIIEPIYVACGFAQYINRRTYLEAWDIEIAFNHLAQRQVKKQYGAGKGLFSVVLSILIVSFMAISSEPSYAINDAQRDKLSLSESKMKIDKVLSRKEFSTTVEVKYREGDSEKSLSRLAANDDLNSFFNFNLSEIVEVFLWLCLIGGVVVAVVFARRYINLHGYVKKNKPAVDPSDVILGFDLRPESLPTDIVDEAQKLWNSNNKPDAISLLYRAALVNFISQDGLQLLASATERDCLKIIEQHSSSQRSQLFKAIVISWENIAYAHQVPDDKSFNHLCHQWPLLEVKN